MEMELILKDLLMLFCYIYILNQLYCCIMYFVNFIKEIDYIG